MPCPYGGVPWRSRLPTMPASRPEGESNLAGFLGPRVSVSSPGFRGPGRVGRRSWLDILHVHRGPSVVPFLAL